MASNSSQDVSRHSLLVSHHKGPCPGCLSRLDAQGSAITAFNPLAAQRCVLYRQWFFSSVSQAVAEATLAFMTKAH